MFKIIASILMYLGAFLIEGTIVFYSLREYVNDGDQVMKWTGTAFIAIAVLTGIHAIRNFTKKD